MQANAVEGTNESQLDLLLTQPFTPIFLSTEDRQEEKLLEEVEAFMKEPLSGENHENVDVHEQKMTNYEYIEPLYQTEFGASFVPTELSTTKNELVNIYRELALQVPDSASMLEFRYAYIQ